MVNHKEGAVFGRQFRQALYYAIDRQALVENALRGYGYRERWDSAPDSEWYNPGVEQYTYDPTKAIDLIKEIGYTKDGQYFTKDGKPLEMEMLVTSDKSAWER